MILRIIDLNGFFNINFFIVDLFWTHFTFRRGEVCPRACVFASVHIPLEQPIILWVRAVSRSPFMLRFKPAA